MAKKRKSKKKQMKLNTDIKVILLILLGIVLAILIYGNSGYVGNFLNEILGGIMGIFKYIVPVVPFVSAIYMFSNNKEDLLTKIIPSSIILLCCSATMTLYQILNNALEYNIQFQEILDRAFYLGKLNKGGGVIGLLISYPLVKLFEPIAALIIIIGIAIIVAVMVFGLKPSEHISKFVNKMEDERKINRTEEQKSNKIKKQSVIQEDLGDVAYAKPETARERKQREKEERRREALKVDEQLTINMLEQEKKAQNTNNSNGDYIEGNLFKQEEEKKEEKKKEVLQLEHALVVEDEHYEYPPVELLSKGKKASRGSAKMLADTAAKLQKTLYSFGVSAKVENVSVGPTITRYELKPAEGTRVSKIANLADDIELKLQYQVNRLLE